MPLAKLAESMHSKGFIVIHDQDSVIEKLIHKLDDKFHALIKHYDGNFKVEVVKVQRETKGLYSREEYLECKEAKENFISKINESDIGVTFNKLGTTKF